MSGRRSDRVTVALRLPADLRDRLDAAARERDLGRNALVTRLLERGLDQLAPLDTGELRASLRPEPGDFVRVQGIEP